MNHDTKFRWHDLDSYIAGAAIGIMTMVVAVNSMSRYFFNNPLVQAEEIATSMFVWLIFIGSSICYKERMHIGIDCFVNMLPKKGQYIVDLIVDVILLLANAFMGYLSYKITVSAWSKLTPAMRMPYSFIDVAAFIAFALMVCYSIRFIRKDIDQLVHPQTQD